MNYRCPRILYHDCVSLRNYDKIDKPDRFKWKEEKRREVSK